jgi:hypothetical protein
MAMLRRAWNDSVGSKVIAAGITAALAAGGAFAAKHLERLSDEVARLLARTVTVPAWLALCVLFLLSALMVAVVVLRRKRARDQSADIQPNAVPIVLKRRY